MIAPIVFGFLFGGACATLLLLSGQSLGAAFLGYSGGGLLGVLIFSVGLYVHRKRGEF